MADRYPNFAALAAEEKHGIDYQIRLENRGTPIVVLAPHGGWIEPGTSELVAAIAREDMSFYAFEGLCPRRPHGDLHITSTRFDEPQAMQLVGSAEIAIAIHGRADGHDPKTVLVGGREIALGETIGSSLRAAGFEVASAQSMLAGRDPSNICNRGTAGVGVQLELPRTLRRQLTSDHATMQSFGDAVRKVTTARQSTQNGHL